MSTPGSGDSRPGGPKRRIVVRVTQREKNDPDALLNAVKNAMSGFGFILQVKLSPGADEPGPLPDTINYVKDEALETVARQLAQAELAAKAAAAEKERATRARDADIAREEVVALRKGIKDYLLFWLGQGVRITVQVIEKTTVPLADAISKVASIVGGKKPGE